MNKTLIALSLAFFGAATLVAPVAEAGGCGGGGGYSSYKRSVKRTVKPRASLAQRKISKPVSVAKAETETKSETVAKVAAVENSSITTASEKVAAAPVKSEKTETVAKVETETKKAEKTDKVATAAQDVGCKQFFPTIGQTLSVACQK